MQPYSRQSISSEDIATVCEVLQSDFLTQGPFVERFESALADFLGVRFVLVMNSATSALYAAYASAGIQAGDEVITTPISFVATSNMLLALGAIPVFCDVKEDGNINEALIPGLITPKTRAIVSVDYSGNPVDCNALGACARQYGLKFISDSSHALGAFYQGLRVGSQADATIFSFHAIKPITTGEGGALVTNDQALYERAKLIRSHGVMKKNLWNSEVESWGFNFRLSDINAALGFSQLHRLDQFIQRRQEIALCYDQVFGECIFAKPLARSPRTLSSHHLYPLLLSRSLWCSKEEIFSALHARGLGVQIHYKPIHTFVLYRSYFPRQSLQNAEAFYLAELSIPCHQSMTLEDAKDVADNLLEVFDSFSR